MSALAGVLLLAPIASVHSAGSGTISLSATSGSPGTFVTVTGTGFAPGSAVTITQTTTGTTTATLSPGAAGNSLLLGNALVTDADGNFLSTVSIAQATGGAQTITVSDAAGNSQTATFTVTQSFALYTAAGCASTAKLTSGFVDQTFATVYVKASGFGAGESVGFTSTPTPFSANFATLTTTAAGQINCVADGAATVVEQAGGATTITAKGVTSGDTATATFTINPLMEFFANSGAGLTGGTSVFSFNPAQFSTIFIGGVGFPAGTVAASTMTVAGVTVGNPGITIPSSGTITWGAPHLGITLSGAITNLGNVAVTFDGYTFSQANGNIACSADDAAECVLVNTAAFSGLIVANGVGGPMILSANTNNPTISTDASSYKPGAGALQSVYGVGGVAAGAVALSNNAATAFGYTTSTVEQPAGAGTNSMAFWSVSAAIPDLAGFSTTGTPTSITISQTGTFGASSTSFGITPWVSSVKSDTTDYTGTRTYSVHGFANGEPVILYVGGSKLLTIAAAGTAGCALTTGATATCTSSAAAGNLPDLASGSYSITATGSVSTATATGTNQLTYYPAVQLAGAPAAGTTTAQSDLTIFNGPAGTLTILRTGLGTTGATVPGAAAAFGVHGLAANTAYEVTWGIASTSSVVTTFTSTAAGQMPGGGVQFNTMSGAVGIHILDIRLASTGADVIFGDTQQGDGAFSSQGWVAANTCATATQYCGQYGDLLFSLSASILPSPTVGPVGTTVALSGSALKASTTYYVHVATCNLATCGYTAGSQYTTSGTYQATFTTTSTGTIPTGVTLTFPSVPAAIIAASGFGSENATTYQIFVDTTTTNANNYGFFVLQASASLSATSATPGSSVTVSGTGLDALSSYNVVMNKVVVGGFVTNGVGTGSASFTVPASMAPGAYTVYLTRNTDGKRVLVAPPTLTVSASATGGLTAQTLTASTAPAEAPLNGYPTVSQTYTNTASAPLSVYMWVSVQNAAGQTVGVFLGSATVAAGGSTTIAAALNNIPSGTYTATVFCTTSSGVVISSTSSTSSFSF